MACFCFALASACRRRAFFFSLDRKETKDQGMDLILNKPAKSFFTATPIPDEKSGRTRCRFVFNRRIISEAFSGFFFASPAAASFFSLDRKETKDQGMDLILNKPAKSFFTATQVPDEKSGRTRCRFVFNRRIILEAFSGFFFDHLLGRNAVRL